MVILNLELPILKLEFFSLRVLDWIKCTMSLILCFSLLFLLTKFIMTQSVSTYLYLTCEELSIQEFCFNDIGPWESLPVSKIVDKML